MQIHNIELVFDELVKLHDALSNDEQVESVLEDVVEVEWDARREAAGAAGVFHLALDSGDDGTGTGTQLLPYRTLRGLQAGVQNQLARPENKTRGLLVLMSSKSESGEIVRKKQVLVRRLACGCCCVTALLSSLPSCTDSCCEHGTAETPARVQL